MVEFLEELLLKNNFTLLFISHDRYFIDNIATNVVEVDDEARMIQVFQNILGNAYKFTDESGMIQTKFIEKDGQLNISIFNTGKKIPEEDIELIFDKFYQSKNQNIRKPIGTGLGLAICKKIIEAHKGEISAENKEIGVVFNIKLNS
jgi:signal transduction histidine kinase